MRAHSTVTVCSIAARNYIAHARVLAASFRAVHPDGEFVLLLVDDEDRTSKTEDESFPCVRLADIGIDPEEAARLAGIYDVTELATAVKPRLLQWALSGGRDHVLYLDPDVKVYAALDGCTSLARRHGIVLTPHTTTPIPRDNRNISVHDILRAGVFNLGFIGVGAGAEPFLQWWWEQTRREGLIAPEQMLFTDQRWIDLVPALFDHAILKNPGYNVAYWNLHGRDLTWEGRRYEVNGEPLRFFHFSGFDHRRPEALSRHQGSRPRIVLSERPSVARICGEYVSDLQRAGGDLTRDTEFGWSVLPSGIRLDRHIRRLYWAALVAHECHGEPEPINPFDAARAGLFLDWLNEAAAGAPPWLSRYFYAIYQNRPDVREALPDPHRGQPEPFRAWLQQDGVEQERIAPALLRPLRSVESTPAPAPAS